MTHPKRCTDCGTIQRNGTRCANCTQHLHDRRYGGNWHEIRKTILQRDGYKCQLGLPGCTTTATQVDHITPFINGGTNTPDNLQAACSHCNRQKSDQ